MQAGEVAISGPDAPTDGDQYTASGGAEPYTWSIGKGSITQDGVVTASGQCGEATVSATDNCGNTGTKDVRLPSGGWVLVSSTGYGCNSCEVTSGTTKTVYCWTYCCAGRSDGSDCVALWRSQYGSFLEFGVPPCLTPPYSDCCSFYPCSCRCTMTYGILGISQYEWRCP